MDRSLEGEPVGWEQWVLLIAVGKSSSHYEHLAVYVSESLTVAQFFCNGSQGLKGEGGLKLFPTLNWETLPLSMQLVQLFL